MWRPCGLLVVQGSLPASAASGEARAAVELGVRQDKYKVDLI